MRPSPGGRGAEFLLRGRGAEPSRAADILVVNEAAGSSPAGAARRGFAKRGEMG